MIASKSEREAMKVTRSAPVMVHAAGDDAGAAANEEYYFLSNLDQNVTVLMKTIHVFSMSGEKRNHVREVAPLLRESLSRVLRHYYPLEGSLAVRADGTLAVRNDRRGVPFVEAVSDDYELRQVVAAVAATEPGAEVLAGLVYVGDDQEQRVATVRVGEPVLIDPARSFAAVLKDREAHQCVWK